MVQARGLGTLFPRGSNWRTSLYTFLPGCWAQNLPEVPLRCTAIWRFDIIRTLQEPGLHLGVQCGNRHSPCFVVWNSPGLCI